MAPFLIGVGMCGPTLVDLGTPEQKARYLRPLLRGEEIWCLGRLADLLASDVRTAG